MLAWLLALPALVKVLASLGLILLLNRMLGNLMVAVALATGVLALWAGHPPAQAAELAAGALLRADTLLLLAVILLVVFLSAHMRAGGVMDDLVRAVGARLSPRLSMAVLPALIGFLPMPGGALFSAPLVDSLDAKAELAPLRKVWVNYWFRHSWEPWWPIDPAVLMLLHQTGLEVWQVILLHLPVTALLVLGGWWFLLKPFPRSLSARPSPPAPPPRLLPLLAPIGLIILLYALIQLLLPAVHAASRYLPMALAIGGSLLYMQRWRPLPGGEWRRLLLAPRPYLLAATVALITVYGAVVQSEVPAADGRSVTLVSLMQEELARYAIPPRAVMILIPFICGLVTGVGVAHVGASFPIVMALLGDSPSLPALLAATVLAYTSGYLGMMFSPVHVCIVVTAEHFRTRLLGSLGGLVPPALLAFAGAVGLHLAIHWFGGA